MVEVTDAGTALMSPEEVKQERMRREAAQTFAAMQRFEEQKSMWHTFSKVLPFAAAFLGLCFLGIIGFTSLKIMGDAWNATSWLW